MKRQSLAMFQQTLIVLVGALILSHLAGFVALVLLPLGGPSAVTLSEIARQLGSGSCQSQDMELSGPASSISLQNEVSEAPTGMTSDSLLQGQLARALKTTDEAVRLAWPQNSEIRTGVPVSVTVDDHSFRVEETIFFGGVFAARQQSAGWCVLEIPGPRWYNHWKTRVALNLLLSLAVFLLLAWWFARRLARPVRDFATAADAIGQTERPQLLEEKGPWEMHIAARSLNAMQRRVEEQSREREAMIASIAHDLRGPLTRVAVRVQGAPDTIREGVERDVEKMNEMIDATLEYSREAIADEEKTTVDLERLLHALITDEQAINHHISFIVDSQPIFVLASEAQLNRLFQNLLDNGRKFAGVVEVYLGMAGGNAVVEIADRGPGIEEGLIDTMLRPFTRAESVRIQQVSGMGLGLSIACKIVKRHGGELCIENRAGGGLLVRVILPLSTDIKTKE